MFVKSNKTEIIIIINPHKERKIFIKNCGAIYWYCNSVTCFIIGKTNEILTSKISLFVKILRKINLELIFFGYETKLSGKYFLAMYPCKES